MRGTANRRPDTPSRPAAVYAWFVSPKSPAAGVTVGLVWGFGAGVMMGYGSFGSTQIPYLMALVWFLGTWLEFTVAGLLAGLLESRSPPRRRRVGPPPTRREVTRRSSDQCSALSSEGTVGRRRRSTKRAARSGPVPIQAETRPSPAERARTSDRQAR